MNRKKSLSEEPWAAEEIRAMRAEQPNPAAVEQTVAAMLNPVRPAVTRAWVWRGAALATAAAVLAVAVMVRPQQASAASLSQIAAAVRAKHARHEVVYRPDASGNTTKALETWVDGVKFKSVEYVGSDPGNSVGYDGAVMFRWSPKNGGFVDDVEPVSFPVESIDSYLQIPGVTLERTQLGVDIDGRTADLYIVRCPAVVFDLFVDPKSRLPIVRQVRTIPGVLIEKNVYDYPSAISSSEFEAPHSVGAEPTNYPRLREDAKRLLAGPGLVRTVGGVQIKLYAVYVGSHSLLAVWSGGADAPVGQPQSTFEVEGFKAVAADGKAGRIRLTNRPEQPATNEASSVFARGVPYQVEAAWFDGAPSREPTLTVKVPAWRKNGSFAGYAKFDNLKVIFADDPQRVLWRPVSGPQPTQAAKR